jgi:hypothetical protein
MVLDRAPDVSSHDRAVQVELMESKLKAPGIKRWRLEHDTQISSFAFNFKLRRYSAAR